MSALVVVYVGIAVALVAFYTWDTYFRGAPEMYRSIRAAGWSRPVAWCVVVLLLAAMIAVTLMWPPDGTS